MNLCPIWMADPARVLPNGSRPSFSVYSRFTVAVDARVMSLLSGSRFRAARLGALRSTLFAREAMDEIALLDALDAIEELDRFDPVEEESGEYSD